MIIAHLPLGYLATKTIVTKCSNDSVKKSYLIKAGLIGSITPDLDMFYFYIFDNCQHHHHTYWIHIPFYWGIILGLFFLMFLFIKKDLLPLIGIFGIDIFIHLFADSIAGDIWWFSPFTNKPYSLFTVPSIYKIWWGNFILHWSFLIEITLILIAIYIFINSRKKYSLSSGNTICIAQIFHKYAQYLIYHID